ncbi:low temperature requirement protein A [Micromonospora sp. NPDC048830]|uniref:low temperature requirement protein A n=1 Tax=Micromonospora sp. NPDC048830 TaxID=3364257 RepID=UPI00371562F1
MWWSWTAYSWLANQARADEGLVRIAMIVATMAVFAVGLAVPEANHDRDGGLFGPMVFVCAYLVARCTHGAVYILAAVGEERARREVMLTVLASMLPSGILLTAGALLGSSAQVCCVSAAAAIEPAVAHATTRGLQGRINSAAHFAERHGLVVMLALGESITALGFGATIGPISLPILAGVILAVLAAVPLLATLSPLAVLSTVAGTMVALLLAESLLTSDGLRLTWPTLHADECPRWRQRTGTGDIDAEPSVGVDDVHRRRQT